MLYFYFLRCALTSLLVLWMTESALSIVCAYFLCDDNISFSKSRCSPLCGAVSRWDVLCGSWGQTWVLHTRVRVTFTLSVWAQGKHPVPTCETGSPESWDHAQLPLLSHRSVSPPSFTESCGFPVSRFIWSDSCRACSVCFRLRGEENHLCFFFWYASLQLSKRPWCGFKASLSVICYPLSSGCHCLGLSERQTHKILLDFCQFPCHFVVPIRL